MTMTNNPTIDGVSRGLIEMTIDLLQDLRRGTAVERKLRALLDAPAVDRQEPVGELEIYGYQCRQSEQEKFFLCEYPQFWQHIALVRKDDAEAQASALQSTIARLEARITQLESEKEFAAATYQAARDRIAEMESGRGEPVAWMCFDGEGNYDFTEDPETAEAWRKSNGEQYADWLTPLFTAPPAPVAHTMKSVMSAVCAITGFPMLTSNQCHALAQSLNACLDATAALNGPKS